MTAIHCTLFSTPACHLCDQAEELLSLLAEEMPLRIEIVDISEDAQLMERYGIRIPVLRRADGEELNWPFALQSARGFLAE